MGAAVGAGMPLPEGVAAGGRLRRGRRLTAPAAVRAAHLPHPRRGPPLRAAPRRGARRRRRGVPGHRRAARRRRVGRRHHVAGRAHRRPRPCAGHARRTPAAPPPLLRGRTPAARPVRRSPPARRGRDRAGLGGRSGAGRYVRERPRRLAAAVRNGAPTGPLPAPTRSAPGLRALDDALLYAAEAYDPGRQPAAARTQAHPDRRPVDRPRRPRP